MAKIALQGYCDEKATMITPQGHGLHGMMLRKALWKQGVTKIVNNLTMAKRKGSGIEDLILLAWWVSLVFAGLVYIGSRIASAAETTNISAKTAASMAAEYAPYRAVADIVISEHALKGRRLYGESGTSK